MKRWLLRVKESYKNRSRAFLVFAKEIKKNSLEDLNLNIQ